MDKIKELEEKISALPLGYVVKKTISGKVYYYHQWKEGGKSKSFVLKANQVESLKKKIERRKKLQKELSALKKKNSVNAFVPQEDFAINAAYGKDLEKFIQSVKDFQKRDCFSKIDEYVNSPASDKVCVVYGLRRTGKTTLLEQQMLALGKSRFSRTVYIKARVSDTISYLGQAKKNSRTRALSIFSSTK